MKSLLTATFREILESTRQAAGVSAWERARQSSRLRHLAVARGDHRGARHLFQLKMEAMRRSQHVNKGAMVKSPTIVQRRVRSRTRIECFWTNYDLPGLPGKIKEIWKK